MKQLVVDRYLSWLSTKVESLHKRDFLWRYASIFPEHALQRFCGWQITAACNEIYFFWCNFFISILWEIYVTYRRCSDTPNRPKQPLDPNHTIMKSLSPAQHNHVLSLLDAGQSACQSHQKLVYTTLLYPASLKAPPPPSEILWGRPSKLSSADVRLHNVLLPQEKAENAVQITKILRDIRTSLCPLKQCTGTWRKQGWRLLWRQRSHCSPSVTEGVDGFCNCSQRLDSGGLETCGMVRWDKINHLGSDGRRWVWKKTWENLSDRLVEGTLKFGGGSVMLWGCMMWEGTGYACKIDGRMDGTFLSRF